MCKICHQFSVSYFHYYCYYSCTVGAHESSTSISCYAHMHVHAHTTCQCGALSGYVHVNELMCKCVERNKKFSNWKWTVEIITLIVKFIFLIWPVVAVSYLRMNNEIGNYWFGSPVMRIQRWQKDPRVDMARELLRVGDRMQRVCKIFDHTPSLPAALTCLKNAMCIGVYLVRKQFLWKHVTQEAAELVRLVQL